MEIIFFFFFWPCRAACMILVPPPGIQPTPPAVEALSLNHWTTREVLEIIFYYSIRTHLTNSVSEKKMNMKKTFQNYKTSLGQIWLEKNHIFLFVISGFRLRQKIILGTIWWFRYSTSPWVILKTILEISGTSEKKEGN